MKHYRIKIELKSDLCAASGSGHGCYIDSDVCFDKFGFPYIPAKRLKGCLLEAANELIEWESCTEEDKKRLFGEKGLNEGGAFSISNAYIENYREIYTMLDEMYSQSENVHNQQGIKDTKNENKGEKQIKRSDIINYFTSTRTRTAINESTGAAKDGSLRTIRVINCIDPIKKEKFDNLKNEDVANKNNHEKNNENNIETNINDINRVFIAEASLSDPSDKELLVKCCKALRHIGSHRTRGFGAVKLSLEENNAIEKNVINISDNCNKIKLLIRLDSPIMISSNKASESMDYIPGSTILGYFAGQYLKYNKDDENFYKFFVNGQEDGLYFSNFYISDKNYSRYFPAPVTCKKEKISEGICYNSVFYEKEQKQNPSKSLTNKFIRDIDIYPFGKLPDCKSSKENNCKNEYEIDKKRFVEVKKEVFYHHARPVDDKDGKKSKDKAIDTFYQYNAISADQYFIGEIKGSKEGIKTIVDLLNKNNCKMRIGKSKTAQYGSVTVVKYKEETSDEIKISVNNGNELAVVAQSHIMLLDDLGGNIIKPEEIVKKIAEKLFGKDDTKKYCDNEKISFIKVDQIGSYNRKWNLERPPVPAIATGSVFTFIYTGDEKEINKYISIGERQNEGLGKMYVWVKDAVLNDNLALKEKDWISTSNKEKAKTPDLENVLSILINNIKRQENLLKLKKKALYNAERLNNNSEKIDNQQKLSINSTTINNLLVKYINGWKYSDFVEFISYIKDTDKRKMVEELVFKDKEEGSLEINSSNESNNSPEVNTNSINKAAEEKRKDLNEIKESIERFEDVKKISNNNAKEELLEYYLKYYYINLLTQCRLNIRIIGNEKGGDKNDK
ncbi:hypothetical protein EHE19_011360 [Ruminiclostridium herbifermentans]|uniref:CRISPR type III-associated protein domain-containing protein n=1 Tax=Ruminiclostridium herbifermentans TaxID=2488810 RepID=A0A4U7JM93_9FIRM|nr:RAMP superfamily CRISPR-associated protein [Ruminiclostridium herbifermentans]QNU65525.1 hypothetical protein EHE19_011360 [Ruminiclostridium herbifermentans]